MDAATKARARLSLLAEKARGLRSVPAAAVAVFPAEEQMNPAPPEPTARREPDHPKLPVKSPAQSSAAGTDPVASGLRPMEVTGSFDAPLLNTEEKRARLVAMNENEVRGCTRCRLCEQRTHTVFGEGDVDSRIFFIGEGPGENEDQTGRPFVGRAGELLNKMIGGMGLKREQVYIANIVKCRPPNNRVPSPDEVATCTPFLLRQLEIVRPRTIVTLGLPSTQYMLQSKLSMGKLRGTWHDWRGIKLMPTYHPAYVLRNPTYETRAAVWGDLKLVLAELRLPVPSKHL